MSHQLEVRDSHRALVIHLLLVFVARQTLHQVPGVDLVVGHLLRSGRGGQPPDDSLGGGRRRKRTYVTVGLDDGFAGSHQQRLDLNVLPTPHNGTRASIAPSQKGPLNKVAPTSRRKSSASLPSTSLLKGGGATIVVDS